MQILNCDNLINSCCSDYGLARVLSIANKILNLIHLIVPIILIVMVVINLSQLVTDPEEKKLHKKLKNKVLAAIMVFFVPTLVNAVLNILPNSYELYGCMKAAQQLDTVEKSNETIYTAVTNEEKKKAISNPSDYEKGEKTSKNNYSQYSDNNKKTEDTSKTENNKTDTSDTNTSQKSTSSNENKQSTSNNGKGPILLIAGHSYPPYCKQYSDCRGTSSASGYAEEDETRKLVKLIKSNLDSLNVKSDIANALLAGDTDKMNKSFFIESKNNSDLFNSFDWSKYSFVLEVHFNATSKSNAKGTLLCKKSSSYSTKADNDIVNAVISHTGNTRLGDSIQTLNNVSYFTKRNIPIVYLETEFYDNAEAMKVYTNHMNEIALDIARAIQKHYG